MSFYHMNLYSFAHVDINELLHLMTFFNLLTDLITYEYNS